MLLPKSRRKQAGDGAHENPRSLLNVIIRHLSPFPHLIGLCAFCLVHSDLWCFRSYMGMRNPVEAVSTPASCQPAEGRSATNQANSSTEQQPNQHLSSNPHPNGNVSRSKRRVIQCLRRGGTAAKYTKSAPARLTFL